MLTDVEQPISVASPTPSNMSENSSNIPSSSENQQPKLNITQQSIGNPISQKKKKKKKTPSNSAPPQPVHPSEFPSLPAASPSSSPDHPDSSVPEQWHQRVQSLRTALNKAQKDNQLLTSDLAAALARASDAEHAEDAVNKGLLTARSVISQRDRTVAELKTNSSNLRADLTHLQEEKKKTDKRLILLKTVSANLQEAREARDAFEKKLEDANAEVKTLIEQISSLEKEKESLKQLVETMEMVKQQLSRREIEIDELARAKLHVEEEARQGEMRAYGVGAVSVLAVNIIFRLLSKGRGKREE